MTRCKASFFSCLCFGVCFVLLPRVIEAILKDACPDEARIILSPEERREESMLTSMRNLTLEFDDFPQNLTWFANGSTYGCVCDVFSCLRLCCPRGNIRENATCIPMDGDFVDQWPDIYFRNLTLKPSDDFFPIVGYPCGKDEGYVLDPFGPVGSADDFYLLDDGLSIHTVIDDSVTDQYCLLPEDTEYVPLMCFPTDSNVYLMSRPVQVTGFVISILFLLVTLIVYVLLPELNTIHGLTLRCYVASLGLSFIFLVTDRLASFEDSVWLCRFVALGIQFSFIASFTWLNVMCIDIWLTFGSRNIIIIVLSNQKRRKFLFYSIYAWGITSIFSGVCIIMELVPGLSKDLILPDIAWGGRCWFASWEAEVAYFFGPLTVIVICNTFMFFATAMKMIWHQKTVASRLGCVQSRQHQDAKKWLILYFKLFIVMGINFITEVITWWWQEEDLKYLWYITDAVNLLQGFTIFVILVCKKKVILSLKRRFKQIWHPRKDNELSMDSLSTNASRRTRDNTSTSQTEASHGPSTSESILSSNSHRCSPLKNMVEARD